MNDLCGNLEIQVTDPAGRLQQACRDFAALAIHEA